MVAAQWVAVAVHARDSHQEQERDPEGEDVGLDGVGLLVPHFRRVEPFGADDGCHFLLQGFDGAGHAEVNQFQLQTNRRASSVFNEITSYHKKRSFLKQVWCGFFLMLEYKKTKSGKSFKRRRKRPQSQPSSSKQNGGLLKAKLEIRNNMIFNSHTLTSIGYHFSKV
jgi:hypothetical protein